METAMPSGGAPRLSALRRQIAAIEGTRSVLEDRKILPLGVAGIDAALGGGFACGALHELQPAGPLHLVCRLLLEKKKRPAPAERGGAPSTSGAAGHGCCACAR